MKEDLIGLEVIDNQVLRCADCGITLAEVILTETNEGRSNRGLKTQKTKFKVDDCFKCGGSTFESKVFEGTVSVGTTKDGLQIDTKDTDVEPDGTIFTVLTVRKTKNAKSKK